MRVRTWCWLLALVLLMACGGDDAADAGADPAAWEHCYAVGEEWPQSYPAMTEEMALQLAVRWNMCAAFDGTNLDWLWKCAMGTCLPFEIPALDAPSMECILAAETCDEVRCCWGINSAAACDPEEMKAHCDGDVVVECDVFAGGLAATRRWDCAWSGGNPVCLLTHDGAPLCGSGTCDPETLRTCDGNVLVICVDGVERHVDCEERGRICAPYATDDGIEAACVLASDCLLPHCEGNVAVYCAGGTEVMRHDCAWYGSGYSCVEGGVDDGTWSGGCKQVTQPCDAGEDIEYCDGAVAHYCASNGTWLHIDCSVFGGGTCRKYWSSGPVLPTTEEGEEPDKDPTDPTQGNGVGCSPPLE